jgi:hypothetical protein
MTSETRGAASVKDLPAGKKGTAIKGGATSNAEKNKKEP